MSETVIIDDCYDQGIVMFSRTQTTQGEEVG